MTPHPGQSGNVPAPLTYSVASKKAQRGHSLLEVMIALALCTILVFQVVMLNLLSRRLTQQAGAQAAAYLAVERQLETVRAQTWESRVTSSQSVSFDVPTSVNAQFFDTSQTTQKMLGRYAVTQVSSTLQQASACVRWPNLSAPGKYSEACADTYIAKSSQ